MPSSDRSLPEPWLQGTLADVPPVQRAVLHALELARLDAGRFCAGLTDVEINARPIGLAPVAFHLRHIARSIDRLLTYAEGRSLSNEQSAALKSELDASSTKDEVMSELLHALTAAESRIRAFDATRLNEVRNVGRKQLPSTVAGLLIHIADHTQRHVGQAITTAKVLLAQRPKSDGSTV
jgi:uncharacterized damage-inducible protein DinB